MDLQSLMAAYSSQELLQQQPHHLLYFPADRDDDPSLSSLDDAAFQSYDDADDDHLLQAGASDMKGALARAAYPPTPPDIASAGALGPFVPTRLRSVPPFYPSSATSAFNPSIVYDEVGGSTSRLHPGAAFHQPAAPPPASHGFFASWPAPSSASPLLIIDDRGEGARGGSTASTQSGASMGSVGHVFSMSSPSPFDTGVVGEGEGDEEGTPSRLKGGVWGVAGVEATASPPGLGPSAVGRFSSPLVIIDDGQVIGREGL